MDGLTYVFAVTLGLHVMNLWGGGGGGGAYKFFKDLVPPKTTCTGTVHGWLKTAKLLRL